MTTFTLSSTRYGLFEVTPDSPLQAGDGGEMILRLFVLNGDSEKSREAATSLLEVAEKLPLKKLFTVIVAKPRADVKATVGTDEADVVLKLSVTGSQMIARAKAILALRDSDVKPETIKASSKTGTRKMGSGLASGLVK